MFPNDVGIIPSNPVLKTALGAMFAGGRSARKLVGGWQSNEVGGPVYHHYGSKGGSITAYPRPITSANEPLATAETLWEIVENLSPMDRRRRSRRARPAM